MHHQPEEHRCERLLVDRNQFCRKRKRFFIVDDDERGWKLFCAFLGGRMKANEERENCGVFRVKDTICIHM